MDGYNDSFKPLNLKAFLKDSVLVQQTKEYYPEYIKQLFENIIESWNNDETDKAIYFCDAFTQSTKDSHIGILLKALIQFKELDLELLKIKLNKIQPKVPYEKLLLHLLKAITNFTLLDIDQSRVECDILLQLEPTAYEIYFLKGCCLALREKYNLAIPNFIKALKSDFKLDEIKSSLAYCYLRVGKSAKALSLFKKIVDKFPNDYKVQYNMGLCYKRFKKHKKAIHYFDLAITLKDDPMFRLTRAYCLIKLRQFEVAREDLKRASEKSIPLAEQLFELNEAILRKEIPKRKVEKHLKLILKNQKVH